MTNKNEKLVSIFSNLPQQQKSRLVASALLVKASELKQDVNINRSKLRTRLLISLLGLGCITTTGCMTSGGFGGYTSSSQDFVLAGSPEGIRAFNDGYIGMAKTAKESPDANNQYIQYRDNQEREVTARVNHQARKGFMQKIFGGGDDEAAKPGS